MSRTPIEHPLKYIAMVHGRAQDHTVSIGFDDDGRIDGLLVGLSLTVIGLPYAMLIGIFVAILGAGLYSTIVAAVATLKGPLHGGANEAALNMLREIGTPDRIPHYIERAKDKNDPFRLMGFGHRVYKNYDPRATVMQKTVREVLTALKVTDPVFEVALQLEEMALNDPYFIEKKLFPNVDFYSGIIMRAVGIPMNMFTTMFAIGRAPGYIANWKEVASNPKGRIYRPRQIYIGATKRDYVAMANR